MPTKDYAAMTARELLAIYEEWKEEDCENSETERQLANAIVHRLKGNAGLSGIEAVRLMADLEDAQAALARVKAQRKELLSIVTCIFDDAATLGEVRHESRPFIRALLDAIASEEDSDETTQI